MNHKKHQHHRHHSRKKYILPIITILLLSCLIVMLFFQDKYEKAKASELKAMSKKLEAEDREKRELQEKIDYYDVEILLDKQYILCEDNKLNIYYNTIITSKQFESLDISIKTDLSDYETTDQGITIRPQKKDIGLHNITITVSAENILLAENTMVINVVKNRSLDKEIKALFIGDSLTEAGAIQNTLKDMFGDKFTLYGTTGSKPYFNEGRYGWSTKDYLYQEVKEKRKNVFYNPDTGLFDFNYYIDNNPGFKDVNLVSIFLGQNDNAYNGSSVNINQMIESIQNYNKDISILVISPYNKPDSYANEVAVAAQKDFRWLFSDKESENIYLIPQYIASDMYEDFPYEESEDSEGNTVRKYVDGIHYSVDGYKKIAKVLYGYIQYIFN